VGSNSPVSAGNQQERLSSEERKRWFLAGLIEGEGSVTLSIKAHPTARFGVYVQPEFFIYQHRCRRQLLEMAAEYFRCGRIRRKPGNPDVLVYSVIAGPALAERVLPLLEEMAEFSARRWDYECFAEAVRLCRHGARKSPEGMAQLVELAYAMNMNGKQRRLRKQDLLDRILRGHMPDLPGRE
jgi:LAGLIDADG endonuclease